jgi:hypothetical protein
VGGELKGDVLIRWYNDNNDDHVISLTNLLTITNKSG